MPTDKSNSQTEQQATEATSRSYKLVNALFQIELDKDGNTPKPGALRADGSVISTYADAPVLHPTDQLEALALLLGYQQLEQGLRTPLQSVRSTAGMDNTAIADAICEVWHDYLYDIPQAPDPNEDGHFSQPFEDLYNAVISSELDTAPANPPNATDQQVLRLQWDPSWTLAMFSRRIRQYVMVAWGNVPYSYTLHHDDDTACITRDLSGTHNALEAHKQGAAPDTYVDKLAEAAANYYHSL